MLNRRSQRLPVLRVSEQEEDDPNGHDGKCKSDDPVRGEADTAKSERRPRIGNIDSPMGTGPDQTKQALEGQCHVVFVNGVGDLEVRGRNWSLYGKSRIISALGDVIAVAGSEVETLISTLPGAHLDAASDIFPVLRDRRPDLYGPSCSAAGRLRGVARGDVTELGISLGWSSREDIDRVVALVREAERVGVDACWVIDSQVAMRDAFVLLTILARETERIRVGPGVTNLLTRHETVVATALATLGTLAPGRVMAGVGAGDSAVFPIGLKPHRLSELRVAVQRLRAPSVAIR